MARAGAAPAQLQGSSPSLEPRVLPWEHGDRAGALPGTGPLPRDGGSWGLWPSGGPSGALLTLQRLVSWPFGSSPDPSEAPLLALQELSWSLRSSPGLSGPRRCKKPRVLAGRWGCQWDPRVMFPSWPWMRGWLSPCAAATLFGKKLPFYVSPWSLACEVPLLG